MEWEIINFHFAAQEAEQDNVLFPFDTGETSPEQTAVVCGEPFGEKGEIEVAVYRQADLSRELVGPALIHFDFTSVLIPTGFSAKVEKDGICVLREREV